MSDEFRPSIKLTKPQIKKIQVQYPLFKKVQEIAKLPWYVLAAIWIRETGRSDYPISKGGCYQFDPFPNVYLQNHYLSFIGIYKCIGDITSPIYNFEYQTRLAASFIVYKAKQNGIHTNIEMPDDAVKKLFWYYNGAAYGSPDKSPYVMNGFDEAHKNMRVKGTINGEPVNSTDTNPGAFVIYTQLKLLFP